MEKSDFKAMDKMSKDNMDIRASPTITDVLKTKDGGKITFFVDSDTFQEVSKGLVLGNGKYYSVAYFINRAEFDKIRE